MKTWQIPVSLVALFGAWRLAQRKQLQDRFVSAGVADATASQATEAIIPFWSFTTYDQVTNTIQSDEDYQDFATVAASL